MLGYLALDDTYCSDETVRRSIGNLATFTMRSCHEIDGARVYIIENRHPNNYIYETPRFLLAATGTFIYRDARGNQALEKLGRALAQERTIEDEYRDFHGPYTLIAVDRERRRVCLVTDREGLQHAFVGERNGARALSSNQLLLASISDPALNPEAVREFIHLGRCLERRTLFRHIERIPAATQLTRDNGKWRPQRLWQIQVETPCLPDTCAQAVDKTWAMLDSAVKVADTVEPERLLADLTGGADTRTVLSFLLRRQPQLTVTTGGAADHVDIVMSRRIASRLGLPHFWHPTDQCPPLTANTVNQAVEISDGSSSPLGLLQFMGYFEQRANKFSLNMGGHGGPGLKDHYWLFEFNRTGLDREPNWQRLANLSVVSFIVQDEFFVGFDGKILTDLADIFLKHSENIKGTNNQKIDYVNFEVKVQASTGAWFSMLNQFHDVYHPMLEGEIVQYALNINPAIRKYNTLLFSMIYRNNRTLAWRLTETGVPAVPPVGKFAPLRALVARRYARSAFRKLKTFGFGRPAGTPPRSADPIADSLSSAGYFDLLDYNRMAIAPIVSRERLSAMLDDPKQGSNQTYLMNALAVELIAGRVAELSGRPVARL